MMSTSKLEFEPKRGSKTKYVKVWHRRKMVQNIQNDFLSYNNFEWLPQKFLQTDIIFKKNIFSATNQKYWKVKKFQSSHICSLHMVSKYDTWGFNFTSSVWIVLKNHSYLKKENCDTLESAWKQSDFSVFGKHMIFKPCKFVIINSMQKFLSDSY